MALFHVQFKKDPKEISFELNQHDACAHNGMASSEQKMRFHVNNFMSGHVDEKVNDEFLKWLSN